MQALPCSAKYPDELIPAQRGLCNCSANYETHQTKVLFTAWGLFCFKEANSTQGRKSGHVTFKPKGSEFMLHEITHSNFLHAWFCPTVTETAPLSMRKGWAITHCGVKADVGRNTHTYTCVYIYVPRDYNFSIDFYHQWTSLCSLKLLTTYYWL